MLDTSVSSRETRLWQRLVGSEFEKEKTRSARCGIFDRFVDQKELT
jgi:hypothetical protein